MISKEPPGKFVITESGPTYKILKKLKLEVGENSNIIRKAVFFSLITWFPLLILTLLDGTAVDQNVKIPFLYDYASYTRFLIALPILFVAQKFIRFELTNSISHFVDSGIVGENNVSEFEKIIYRYDNLQSSKLIEIIIFVVALLNIVLMNMFFRSYGDESTWKYFLNGENHDWTIAGYWFLFISFPIYQFLVFHLLWRFLLWSWFLWKISRMNLNLVPSDPDRAAGLGFLGTSQIAFGILGFAQSASFSAEIANKVIYGGVSADVFKFTTLISIVILVLIYLCPLLFFTRKLMKLKLKAVLDYRRLTHKYSRMFEDKWVKGIKPGDEDELLGTGDIQSLADLGNSFAIVENMRLVPFNTRTVILMLLLILTPFLPLLTLKFPISEILDALAGFVF